MNSDASARPRKIEPVYLFWETETILNAPVKDVWPHIVNYPSWQGFSTVKTISGKPGQEGEVVSLQKDEKGFVFPPYYARTIKIELQRRIVWKTFIDKGSAEIDRFGIVDFKLFEGEGKTRFCSNLLYEFLVPYEHESEIATFRETQDENFKSLFASTRPKLIKLVEKGG
jgi:hypothetical protein